MSWITLDDEVGAISHLLTADDVHGPVNLTAPEPGHATPTFTDALGRALHAAHRAADAARAVEGRVRQ